MYRRRAIVAGVITAAAIGAATHGPFLSASSATPTQSHSAFQRTEWHNAEHLIADQHVHVPWDGMVSYNEKTEFCVETFNGTRHDITQYGHGVPPGFYVKFCTNGQYYVNDGVPFKGTHPW
jgi:hypothetical protein